MTTTNDAPAPMRTAPLLKDGDIVERLKQFRLRWQEDGDLTYLGKALVDAVVEIERMRKLETVREAAMTRNMMFGHHPDPSTDFCIEVEALEGWAEDLKAGLRSQWPFWSRLSRLLGFVRGEAFTKLDDIAQNAKPTVLALEGRVRS